MHTRTGKRIARTKLALTKRAVEALEPADKPWIAWDDRLTGFGVRVHPTGAKSFIVNYRAGDGGRKAPNKRVVIGRYGKIAPDQARRLAQKVLGKVAGGDDPAEERAEARAMPTLGNAFEDYMAANPNRSKAYRRALPIRGQALSRRLALPLARCHRPPGRRGPLQPHLRGSRLVAGQPGDLALALGLSPALRRYRGLAQSGRSVARRRRQVPPQGAAQDFYSRRVLPCWRAGIEAEVNNPAIRHACGSGSTPACAATRC